LIRLPLNDLLSLNRSCRKIENSNDIHGRPQKFFQGGGQSRYFACPFQVIDDATQMDGHKTLHPFHTTNNMPYVTGTVAYGVFPLRKFKPSKCLF